MTASSPRTAAEHFEAIDRQLFERLLRGSLDPIVLTLKGGARVTGQPKGVSRGNNAARGVDPDFWGAIVMVTAAGEVTVTYAEIERIG